MRHALFVACLALLLVGCSDPDGTDNNGSNGPVDAGNNGPPDVDNSGSEYADQYTTRVTSLEFTKAPAADLNGIIALNLDPSLEQPIVILYRFEGLAGDAGEPTMTGRSGVKGSAMGEYRYDPDAAPSTAPLTLDRQSGEFSTTFERFRFVSTIEFNGNVQKVDIPVTDLEISGVLALEDGGATATIPQGQWRGHISKSDGDETMVTFAEGSDPRPLTELFGEETLNFDTASASEVEAGTGDAWLVDATYEAEAAVLAE